MGYKRVKQDERVSCDLCSRTFLKSAKSKKRFCSANCREEFYSVLLRSQLKEFRKWRKTHEKTEESAKT